MSALENAAKAGLLVDLDALFDTRLATLDMLDPLLAAHALKNNYLEREDDNFEYCPLELFKKVYACRDTDVLGRSLMTHVKGIVLDFMKDGINRLKSDKTHHHVNVYINVWPYKIAKDAAGELLLPFYKAVGGKANIHLVNIKPEELTPETCKKHFSYIIKYDYIDWLLYLGEKNLLQKTPMQEVTIIAPRLYLSGKPKEDELDAISRNKMQPHQCAEFFFAPYVNIEFYLGHLFSAAIDNAFIERYVSELEKHRQKK